MQCPRPTPTLRAGRRHRMRKALDQQHRTEKATEEQKALQKLREGLSEEEAAKRMREAERRWREQQKRMPAHLEDAFSAAAYRGKEFFSSV